jgi:hypothetical protein
MLNIGQYAISPRGTKIDWADAQADNFHPQIYTTMRRPVLRAEPQGTRLLDVPGFEDDDWENENPRPPIR